MKASILTSPEVVADLHQKANIKRTKMESEKQKDKTEVTSS